MINFIKLVIKNIIMNRLFKTLIPILLISLAISNCKNSQHSEKISKVDSLQTTLNLAEKKLCEIDSNLVMKTYNEYFEVINEFNEVFPDVRDENWTTICLYGNIKSGLKAYVKQHDKIKEEINLSRTQLKNLESDIKNNIVDEENFNKYLLDETEIINSLSQRTNFLIDNAKFEITQYDSLTPLMNNMIEYYKNNYTK